MTENSEIKVCELWDSLDILNQIQEKNAKNPKYTFYDGPPFATGLPHYGHILAGYIKDTVTRFYNYLGHNVPRNAGWDTHGLPIEKEAEKELGISTSTQILEYGIDKYNETCRSIVMRYAGEWETTMNRLGRWIDFKNDYKTMTSSFMESEWWVFKQLFDKGRVYQGTKIMPFSFACGTTLSNSEAQENYQEIQDDSLFIKLPLVNKFCDLETSILVWTTTPWTLVSNYALCVNLEIDYVIIKYNTEYLILSKNLIESVFKKKVVEIIYEFKGSELVNLEYHPAFEFNTEMNEKKYKIIADDYVRDTDGSGIVHIAPAYGEDDYRTSLINNIITKESALFAPLDNNGFVNKLIPELQGVFFKNHKNFKNTSEVDLNTWVIIELKKKNFYFDKRQIVHNYPFCWRTDTPLIYNHVSSWFIRVEDLQDRMVELNKSVNWVPSNIGDMRFNNWLKNAKDWAVSRTRFWGTPIPIWMSEDGDIICIGTVLELETLAKLEPGSITDLHRHFIDDIIIEKDGKIYKRITEVFDCWFESGSMPYASLNMVGIVELLKNSSNGIEYDENDLPFIQTSDGNKHKILPADFIAEGIDQTRGWFYTLFVLSTSLFNTIPFKNVIVNGLVLADDGKKMSKRLQNYPDPMSIVNKYGSDCLRLYLLSSSATRGESLRFSETGVHNMMKDIIIPLSNTIKFWKEYYQLYSKKINDKLIININDNIDNINNPINIWILSEYSKLRNEYYTNMNEYNLKNATITLFKLVEIINNGYIKLARSLIKGKNTDEEWLESLSTLYYIIKYIIIDHRAILPFYCENQYLQLKELINPEIDNYFDHSSIHLSDYYTRTSFVLLSEEKNCLATDFNIIYVIITGIHQLRGVSNISLKRPIKSTNIVFDDTFEQLYSSRYRTHLNFIFEECNIIDLNILNYDQVKINKTIKPEKGLFFKKYGKSINTTFNEISKLSIEELSNIITVGIFNDYEIDETLFKINNTIEFNDSTNSQNLISKEISFNNKKIIIILDKTDDETIDKLYYYRLVGKNIQDARKYAGLHPWDSVEAFWSGESKYDIATEEALHFINIKTGISLNKYNNEICIYENYFENTGIQIYLRVL